MQMGHILVPEQAWWYKFWRLLTFSMKQGPIIVIDDDPEDQQLLANAIASFGKKNQIMTFRDGAEALEFLQQTRENPFLIFCDVKMPRMSGLELREKIGNNETLRRKSIPFVFVTGSSDSEDVIEAYKMAVQGFFVKPNTISEWEARVKGIINYWEDCIHPNNLTNPRDNP